MKKHASQKRYSYRFITKKKQKKKYNYNCETKQKKRGGLKVNPKQALRKKTKNKKHYNRPSTAQSRGRKFIRKVCTLEAKVPAPRDIHSLDELIDHSIRLNGSTQEDSCLTSSGHNEKKKKTKRRHAAVCGNGDLVCAYCILYSQSPKRSIWGALLFSIGSIAREC